MTGPSDPREAQELHDQHAHLERSLEFIRSQEAQMRRALQSPQGRLLIAIKHASQMLVELRTSMLPPKPYYELYNACFDALTLLQGYMREVHRTHHLTDVYEIVEYTGNVLPRLYLMITVGTAYLGSGDAPNQEVMKDMLEMSRGVQHPLRGLFLRYYLGQRTRDFLATASRADLKFSIHFTLTNFVEMNKLWVRYQHQGHSRDFPKRLRQRRELQTVVGSSIYRLAQLDSVDLPAFKELVLPSVLEQVIQCRDPLAQEYLLDVLTQAFPAEYHIDTLDLFFDCVTALVPQTSKRTILLASLSRVYEYAKAAKDDRDDLEKPEPSSDADKVGAAGETGADGAEASSTTGEVQDSEKDRDSAGSASADNAERESRNADSAELNSAPDDSDVKHGRESRHESDTEGQKELVEEHPSTEHKSEDPSGSLETGETSASTNGMSGRAESEVSKGASSEPHVEGLDDDAVQEDSDHTADKTVSQVEHRKPHGDEADSLAAKTSELDISGNDEATESQHAPQAKPESADDATTTFLSDAINLYWHTIQQLDLSSADRAVLVQKFLQLSDLAGPGDATIPLSTLLNYVVKAASQPSAEFEGLILALFDSQHEMAEILALLKQFPQILTSQSRETRHAVAAKVLDNMVASAAAISDVEQAKQVFALFGMLLRSGDLDAAKITQLMHLLKAPEASTTLELLQLAYGTLREGGPSVVKRTFGVLVNTTILLLHDEDITPALVGRALKFVYKVCHDLTTFGEAPLTSYRLYLIAVSAADYVGAEEAAYELFAEALTTYEEHISDSRQQVAALAIAIRTLQRTAVFSEENFDPLAQRCQQSCQRLLKKPDQCRMLLLVATLFWDDNEKHWPKVSETLAKALRIADSIMDTKTSLDLFLDLLESYLYFLGADAGKPTVKVEEVNSLLALIKQNFDAAKTDENDGAAAQLHARMDRIHKYVQSVESDVDEYQELDF